MKIYIFQRLENLTDNFHPEGGLVIIAEDREDAEKLCKEYGANVIEIDWSKLTAEHEIQAEPEVYVFEDSGCC